MASEYGYRLTQKASTDLDDIIAYMAVDLANPKAASDFMDKVEAAIDEARSFPESGPRADNEYLPEPAVRKKYIGHYILYYLPDASKKLIYILRIIYSRRNLDEILWELNP